MKRQDKERFASLRKNVAEMIHDELMADSYCKSYEGTWELQVGFLNYFDDDTATAPPNFYCITLHCYVLGPSRHYRWTGNSWGEALSACEKEIKCWKSEQERWLNNED